MSQDAPTPDAPVLLGQGRYRAGEAGAYIDTVLNRSVSIRQAAGNQAADLRAEAEVLARLNHPGASLVHDLVADGDQVMLVLRRVDGPTLAEALQDEARAQLATPLAVVGLFIRVAEVLAAAHVAGLVHHRVRCSAIRMGRSGRIAVEDWETGLARHLRPVTTRLVRSAPASRTGRPDGIHHDIRDLGACLLSALIRREVEADAQALDTLSEAEAARVPAILAGICRRAMASDATTGYASMEALLTDLDAFHTGGADVSAMPAPRPSSRAWIAVVLALVFVGVVLWRLPRQEQGDHWGEPILNETFSDSSWKQRWKSPHPDGLRFAAKDGRLVSTGARGAHLIYAKRLSTPLRIEYTGEILPGALPCDLSLVWSEALGLDEEPERFERGWGRSTNFQFGGHDNSCQLITDSGHRLPVAYTDRRLEVGRPHRLTVEIDTYDVRMSIDGVEVLHYTSIRPYISGYLILYAHYPDKAFDDLRIWQKPQQPLSPLAMADVLFAPDTYAQAADRYRAVVEAHPGPGLGEEARFRQGLCEWKQGNVPRARELWGMVSDAELRERIACFDVPDDPARWQVKGFFDDFAKTYRERPAMREGLRQTWAGVLEEILSQKRTDHVLIDRFLRLRQEAFPEDAVARYLSATALLQLGRYEDCLEQFPQASQAATALIALGRTTEALDAEWTPHDVRVKALQMVGDYEAMIKTPAIIPVFKVLALCKLGRADAYANDPEFRHPALLHLGQPQHLLASRPLSGRTANEALIVHGRLEEAAYDGLPDVPGSGNDRTALLLLGDLEAAEAQAGKSLPFFRYLLAAEKNDVQALAALRDSVVLPVDLRGHEGWFTPVVGRSLVEYWRGDAQALESGIRPHLEVLSRTYGQRGWFLGRIILGDATVESLDALTAVSERAAWKLLASGIRAELDGKPPAARAAYAAFVDLPMHQRLLALNVPSAEIEWFVAWRLRAIPAGH